MQPLRPQAAQPSLGALGSAAFQALAAADIAPEADFFQKYQACSALHPVITLSRHYLPLLQTVARFTQHLEQCVLCSSRIWGCPSLHGKADAAYSAVDRLYGGCSGANNDSIHLQALKAERASQQQGKKKRKRTDDDEEASSAEEMSDSDDAVGTPFDADALFSACKELQHRKFTVTFCWHLREPQPRSGCLSMQRRCCRLLIALCSAVFCWPPKGSLTSACHAVADTFLDAEESEEEEDAEKGAYDYKDLAAAFDQGGFDGLSQSDTSEGESMSEDEQDDDEATGTGPFKSATKRKQQKQKGKGWCSPSTSKARMKLLSCFTPSPSHLVLLSDGQCRLQMSLLLTNCRA